MRTVWVSLIGTALAAGAASAKDTVYEVNAKQISGKLMIQTDISGKSKAKYDVVARGCIGEVSGELVTLSKTEMLLIAHIGNGGECKIRIIKKGRSVTLLEDASSNCSYFHGAGCAFTQVLSSRK